MTDLTLFIVLVVGFFIVVAVLVAIPLVMQAVRRARGSIQLQIPARDYRSGDVIEGTLQVTAERELGPGRLNVALVCTEVWESLEIDPDGQNRRTKQTKEVYRQGVGVEAELTVGAGEQRTLPFVLPTRPLAASDDPTSGLGRALRAVGDVFTDGRERVWEVKAHYDIPGIDLSADHLIDFTETQDLA